MKITADDLKGGLMAVIRSDSATQARGICTALAQGGVNLLEIAVNCDHGADAIRNVREDARPGVIVGAGSVLSAKSAAAACDAGAAFLVSPAFNTGVHAVAREREVLYVPGILTPTEIMTCMDAGLELLKLFPAGLHGPGYLQDLKGPFPNLKIMPTGGVNLSNLKEFTDAGAWCIGVGGSLLKKVFIDLEDWSALEAEARKYVGAL